FLFQAEDGIRDPLVTGVQTCALPIFVRWVADEEAERGLGLPVRERDAGHVVLDGDDALVRLEREPVCDPVRAVDVAHAEVVERRSEERRVGKGCERWGVAGTASGELL